MEVIDVFQKPAPADGEQIIATPAPVQAQPLPFGKFIGDLSDLERNPA